MLAKYIAGDNKVLLVKLRRDIDAHLLLLVGRIAAIRFDTLVVLVLMKFLFLMQEAIFLTAGGLLVLIGDY